MKKFWLSLLVLVIAVMAMVLIPRKGDAQPKKPRRSALELEVEANALVPATRRVGINLGTWTLWGAEQLCRNILMNPGFEGKVDRLAVIVEASSAGSFSNGRGLGDPNGYWKGAAYDIRTGKSAGKTGTLANSLTAGQGGLPQYMTEGKLPPVEDRDVIMLTKFDENNSEIAEWWIPDDAKGNIYTDPNERRPDSGGTQSAVLVPEQGKYVELQAYLDAIGERAGKLLLVEGKWRLSLWAKGDHPNSSLNINFQRLNDSSPFLSKIVDLTDEWKEYEFEFFGQDTGAEAMLKLGIAALGPDGSRIWIDDIFLGSARDNGTIFRDEVVTALHKLRPSFIRDYQGQMGDTADNRLADLYGRKSFRYRQEASAPSWRFGYSIPDLLQLCSKVGANPWIVLPTTLSDKELRQVGEYLARYADKRRFAEVCLEFGNENWNWVYRPTGIPYPKPCGAVADRAFELIKKSAGSRVNLNLIIQGQYAVPDLALEFGKETPAATNLAVAPYFLRTLNSGSGVIDNMNKLFKEDDLSLISIANGNRKLGKSLSVYEVNLHTTAGTAPPFERDPIVAGAASGTALARRLLQGVKHNAFPQMVFALAGFDAPLDDVPGYVPLWGIMRDLSPTNRFRPTGLSTIMLNHALGGSLHRINIRNSTRKPPLTMAALRTKATWKAVIISEHSASLDLVLTFPDDNRTIPTKYFLLDSASPFDTNESGDNVRIVEKEAKVKGRTVQVTVPAWGFVVFPPLSATIEE